MQISVFSVSTLGEYYDAMSWIGEKIIQKRGLNSDKGLPLMWYRAEESANYTLIPSIHRDVDDKVKEDLPEGEQYSHLHYMEDLRLQHYQAKNYHYLAKKPSSRIEYLEVMQHHRVKTRLLDWSESSTHSLLFALEPYYSQKADNYYKRFEISPCVWVLDPQGLNIALFSALSKDDALIKNLLAELSLEENEEDLLQRIRNQLCEDTLSRYYCSNGSRHIDHIINLSQIEDELFRNRQRLAGLYDRGEPINLLYYLLSRIYSDGILLNNYNLPPLAIVQPYHSQRIRAQRGVFTVFPFYRGDSELFTQSLKKYGINRAAMSYNKIARQFLYKIILTRPRYIAKEVLYNGMNESWLYPEMPYISNEIEYHNVY